MTCRSEQEIRERLRNLENELMEIKNNPNDKKWIKDYHKETAWNVGRGEIESELYGQIDILEWVLVDDEFDGSPDEDPEYGKILMENIQ